MAYVRFMNGANPLWDFISEISAQEPQSNGHPVDRRHHRGPLRPGSWGWSPFDGGDDRPEHGPWSRDMPHRPHHPRHGRGPRGHHYGPPPPASSGDNPPPPPPDYSEDDEARSATLQPEDHPINMVDNADAKDPVPDPEISTPNDDHEDNGPENSGDERFGRDWHGRHGRHGRHGSPHGFGHGGPGFGRRGGWGGHGRGGMRGCRGDPRGFWGMGGAGAHQRHHHPYAHPLHSRGSPPPGTGNPFAPWANMFGFDAANLDPERMREMFAEALHTAATSVHPNGGRARGQDNENKEAENNKKTTSKSKDVDFSPVADIYDAATEYVVHFALPGAKKEDISLNWDAEKSELNVAGVIAREGDEETIKTLALDERDVGVFERKVKLGREGVDAEGITAKMENGLLVVRVPKKVDDEWTEVRQVDIE